MTRPLVIVLESYVAGGADRVVANLLPRLPRVPIDLVVNARCDPSVLLAGALPDNVSLHRYAWTTPAEWADWSHRGRSPLGRQLRRAVSVAVRYPLLWILWLRCRRWLGRRRPRAVWVSNGGYPGGDVCRVATIAAGRLPDCRVVHLVHGLAQAPRRPLRWPELWLDRRLDRSARIVAVSRAVAVSLRAHRALRQEPLVIPTGLTLGPEPAPPPRGPVLALVQVGYFDRNKNHALSIRALGLLRRDGVCNVRLTIVGKEVERGRLESVRRLAEAEGVSSQVRYAGFVSDMDAAYAHCDAVVLTSLVEGLPLCVLEAMRAGRAVVATRAGGVPELVVPHRTGWLLSNADPAELAGVWRRWLANPAELAACGRRARERFVRLYPLDVQAQRMADALGLESGPA